MVMKLEANVKTPFILQGVSKIQSAEPHCLDPSAAPWSRVDSRCMQCIPDWPRVQCLACVLHIMSALAEPGPMLHATSNPASLGHVPHLPQMVQITCMHVASPPASPGSALHAAPPPSTAVLGWELYALVRSSTACSMHSGLALYGHHVQSWTDWS